MTQTFDAAALLQLAQDAEQAGFATCTCCKSPLDGWQSQPLSLDESLLVQVGTLVDAEDPEPTFREFLPAGSSYWAPDAPIAPRFYPYNRSDVWKCTSCNRLFLRYTEGGGYFVDRRIRSIASKLIVDAAPE
ncbi:hypothetical protein [Paraburkholderia bannensis]|uniref:hypothetical protein n=1 Tax=Paraburkholderia bannensis TaxID=765414 RepID=UPI000480E0C3|nr:hypothetical protein [Paraburkholderia bannensis]